MAEYIVEPIHTDEDELQEDAFDQLETRWPGWVPREHMLEVWMIAIGAHTVAEARDVASDVPPAIFQYFGEKIAQVPPIAETAAVVNSTWTFTSNPGGRTIEAGTGVVIEDTDGETYLFEVILDVTIASPTLTTGAGEVQLRAVEAGLAGSGIGGPGYVVEPVESPEWLDTITLTGATSGGADAEDPFDYLDRLTTRMTLLTPRPILPVDFAVLAQEEALERGVPARVAVIDNWLPGTNEVQRIDFTGTVSGGNYALRFTGTAADAMANQDTALIAWNADAATVLARLESLASINPGDVTVTGGPGPADMTITFGGQYAYTNMDPLQVITSTLTGGGSAAIVTDTGGVAPTTNAEKSIAIGVMNAETGENIPSPILTEIDAELQALREINFVINMINPARTPVSVTLVGVALPGYSPTEVDTNVTAAITDFLRAENFGKPTGSDANEWINTTVIRHQDISTVANNVAGFSHWTTLTIGLGGEAQAATDKTIGGVFPVPSPGTIDVTIT